MSKNIFLSFLKQPYPFYYTGVKRWVFGLLIFVMTFYVTYFLQPNEVNYSEHKIDYFWICIVHSVFPLIMFLFCSYFIENYYRLKEKWQVGYEFGFIVAILLLIAFANFFIRDLIYINRNNWRWELFFEELKNTVLIGFLIGGLLVSMNFNLRNYQFQKKATDLNKKRKDPGIVTDAKVKIQTDLKKEAFELNVNNFLYARSDGNYIEIHFLEAGIVKKLLRRMTLTRLQSVLTDFSFIIKVHKSFLVNISQIEAISGNALGLKLKIKEVRQVEIPVSRNNIGIFENRMLEFNS